MIKLELSEIEVGVIQESLKDYMNKLKAEKAIIGQNADKLILSNRFIDGNIVVLKNLEEKIREIC